MTDARVEILELVGRYYRERFAATPFDPSRDHVRYAGRVFGEEELQHLVDAVEWALDRGPGPSEHPQR